MTEQSATPRSRGPLLLVAGASGVALGVPETVALEGEARGGSASGSPSDDPHRTAAMSRATTSTTSPATPATLAAFPCSPAIRPRP